MTRLDPRKADCASCQALCCVALDIEWKNFQKPANEACPHLTKDFRCGVWDDMEAHGCATCRISTTRVTMPATRDQRIIRVLRLAW